MGYYITSGIMTSSRGNNASRLRDDGLEADGESDREGSDENCQILLELIIGELKANDYSSRMPNVAGRKRVENKLLELTGDKNVFWDPEIKSKIAYLRKLWQTNNQLMNRTGVAVDPSSGQIVMPSSWWTDLIAEYGKSGKFFSVLPFKDLLDKIYETQSQTQEGNQEGTQPVSDASNLSASHDEVPKQAKRRISSSRPPRRKANFEAQVESGFRHVIDSRKDLLEELRSRKIQKLSYGDATAILEKKLRGAVTLCKTTVISHMKMTGVQVDEDDAQGVYMKIVRDQIADQLWRANRRGTRRL
ncbi:hypothetical protein YC2023_109379 [Brassica napus]